MMKRTISLLLCVVTILLAMSVILTSCKKNENDKGPFIRMFLSEPIYDTDPLEAFDNADTLQVIGLLYEGLFVADDDGDPKKALVDDYEYEKDDKRGIYTLTLDLKTTYWNDGVQVTAAHAAYAFERLFDPECSHPATAMLYDIKNARKIAEGELGYTVDDLGVRTSASSATQFTIEFEHDIDVKNFLRVLCSPALYPVRDDVIVYNEDWSKNLATMKFSGPFMIRSMNYEEKDGFILERNPYYYKNKDKENERVDKHVTPYRLIADFTTPIEEQLENYDTREKGSIYYFGNIPLAGRSGSTFEGLLKKGDVNPATSTHVYYLNQNAEIGGQKLFANENVRKALSLALDREDIADELVFANPADALVPEAILNRPDRNSTFRKKGESLISTSADMEEARDLLAEAGINPAKFSFSITVYAHDTDHVATAEMAKSAWEELGFKVTVNKLEVYETIDPETREGTGTYMNPYKEALKSGDFQVIALDLVCPTVDAYGILAPFATPFSGNAIEMDYTVNPDYELTPHITGYSSEEYDDKIEEAFDAQKEKDRAEYLHEAEAILMDDMPVIPVVYNQNFSLDSRKLGKIKESFFCQANFVKTKLSGYFDLAIEEGFINSDGTLRTEEEEEN